MRGSSLDFNGSRAAVSLRCSTSGFPPPDLFEMYSVLFAVSQHSCSPLFSLIGHVFPSPPARLKGQSLPHPRFCSPLPPRFTPHSLHQSYPLPQPPRFPGTFRPPLDLLCYAIGVWIHWKAGSRSWKICSWILFVRSPYRAF